MQHGRWPGTWKVVCDVCGFQYASDKVRKRWDNLMVCEADYETKHPQLSIRVAAETAVPSFTRPEPEDVFISICTVQSSQGVVGVGQVGCMIVGTDRGFR